MQSTLSIFQANGCMKNKTAEYKGCCQQEIPVCGVVNMKKKILKAVLGILICWGIFVAIEGFRLIGSTDPGKCPLITLGSTQTADEIADYGSLGFSQTYHLTNGDAFVYGEFRVLGIRIARWES